MRELIRIEGLEKSFYMPAGELKVLKGIDAVFNEGEVVSIVGASGAGKSTFLHVLGTLDKPTSGKVTYKVSSQKAEEGINPFSFSNGELAVFRNKVIGFIFQFHYLLPEFSAIENVMMPGLISRSQKSEVRKNCMKRQRNFLRISVYMQGRIINRENFQEGSSRGLLLQGHYCLSQRLSLRMSRQGTSTPRQEKNFSSY